MAFLLHKDITGGRLPQPMKKRRNLFRKVKVKGEGQMKKIYVLSAIALILMVSSAWGGEKKDVWFDEIVVTATKTERAVDTVPARVEVITKEDIQRLTTSTSKVDDILKYISGVTVVRGNGIFSLGASATLRGLSNEGARTLVLIDGVPINKSDTGEVNFNRINISDIERIEVFKGPASSLYGSNAMGGVINIITTKPDKPLNVSANGFYGTYNTYGGGLEASGRLTAGETGFYIKGSAHYLNSDGYISTLEEKRNAYTVKRFAEEGIGNITLGYDFDRTNSIGFKIDYYNDKRGEGTKIYAPKGVSRDFDTWVYSLNYRGASGSMMWQAKAFWQNENYRRVSERISGANYTRFDVDSDRIDMGIDGSFSWQINPVHLLTIGADIRAGKVDAADIYKTSADRTLNKGSLRLLGLWLQDEITLAQNKLFIIPGIRFDHAKFSDGSFFSTISPFNRLNGSLDENTWTSVTPRLSARYKLSPEASAYISYGRGFRASILDDLCRSGIMWGLLKIANPELKPEKIDSLEIGADYLPFKGLKITSSLYYSVGKDFLYYVPTGNSLDGRPLYKRENIGKVISYGAEIGSNYQISKDLSSFLNYTFSKAYIDEFQKNRALEGQELTRTPRNQVKAGLTFLNPYVNMSLFGIYKSSQYVFTNEIRQTVAKIDGYASAGIKLWKDIARGVTFTLTGENLFNERYTESADEKSPGRFINANLSYRF